MLQELPLDPQGGGSVDLLGPKALGTVKISVDYERCASNAVCMRIAPELFEVRDDGDLYVLDSSPGEEFRDKVRSAVKACPTRALSLED